GDVGGGVGHLDRLGPGFQNPTAGDIDQPIADGDVVFVVGGRLVQIQAAGEDAAGDGQVQPVDGRLVAVAGEVVIEGLAEQIGQAPMRDLDLDGRHAGRQAVGG